MEIWGGVPYFSNLRIVQAYEGPLPPGERGIEFETSISPNRRRPVLGGKMEVGWDEEHPALQGQTRWDERGNSYIALRVDRIWNKQP